jgi:hypothetical protein
MAGREAHVLYELRVVRLGSDSRAIDNWTVFRWVPSCVSACVCMRDDDEEEGDHDGEYHADEDHV